MEIYEYIANLSEINEIEFKKMVNLYGQKQVCLALDKAVMKLDLSDTQMIAKFLWYLNYSVQAEDYSQGIGDDILEKEHSVSETGTDDGYYNSCWSSGSKKQFIDTFRVYLKDISNLPLLSIEKERKYGRIIYDGKKKSGKDAIYLLVAVKDENYFGDFEQRVISFNTVLNIIYQANTQGRRKELLKVVHQAMSGFSTSDNVYLYESEKYNLIKNCVAHNESLKDLDGFHLEQGLDICEDEFIRQMHKIREYRYAKRMLYERNLRLVIYIAKRYMNLGVDYYDLIQEGNAGLLEAIEKYDVTKGFRFSTYATWWIRQAISRSLANQGRAIRIPVYLVEQLNKYHQVKRNLISELGREPSELELAEAMGLPLNRIWEFFEADAKVISLDIRLGDDDDDSTLGDLILSESESIEDIVASSELSLVVSDAFQVLNDRERQILKLRFGFEDGKLYTLEEIGVRLGISRERVRQVEDKALKKLRGPSSRKKLEDFYNS